MASRRFAKRLLDIVSKSISLAAPLSIGVLALGCGIDTEGFSAPVCSAKKARVLLADLKPASPVDYMEIRASSGAVIPTTPETAGDKCKTATDVGACAAAISAATSETGFFLDSCADVCMPRFLIVQSGDEVKILDTKEEVLAFLGPIDTPNEAALVAALDLYDVSCLDPEKGGVREAGDGYEVLATKLTGSCDPVETTLFVLGIDKNGVITEKEKEVIESESGVCIGRRPVGLRNQKARGLTKLGAHLGSIAHLEAASVDAFEQLADELSRNGAPEALVRRALSARKDEIRHARVMQRLARRHGGASPTPDVKKSNGKRSLEEIALDNAVEGCVRETFGALVGEWQSRFSKDPALRRAMRRIARDEARHAALSWAIDAWIRPKLSEEARKRVEQAQEKALQDLAEEARQELEPELVLFAGLPDSRAGEALAASFLEAFPKLAA